MSAKHTCVLGLTAVFAAAAPALAQSVWVVDDNPGPGVDFTNIQDALAVAGPFDLVDVQAGVYPSFLMTGATRVIGRAGAVVTGESRIDGLPPGDWAVVADLEMEELVVVGAAGTVLLDGLEITGPNSPLEIVSSADVRGLGLDLTPAFSGGGALVQLNASRLQLDGCTIEPADAPDTLFGQGALRAQNASLLHVSHSNIRGGAGGDRPSSLFGDAGDGGDALRMEDSSVARIVGSTVLGGRGGYDNVLLVDGFGGTGLVACGAVQEVWDSLVEGGEDLFGGTPPGVAYDLNCGASLQDGVDLPSFRALGAPNAGSPVHFESSAAPGTSQRILFGRFPVRVPVPTSTVDRLVDVGRLASLGATPASGTVSLGFTLPAWPRGTVVFLQTSRTDASGGTEMSNAVALVVR